MEDSSLSFQNLSTVLKKALNNHKSVASNDNTIITIGGADNHGNTSMEVMTFDTTKEEFTNLRSMYKPASFHSLSFIGGYVYVIGGIRGWKYRALSDVIRMNPSLPGEYPSSLSSSSAATAAAAAGGNWEAVKPMLTRRRGHSSAVHGDTIYVFGGYNERSAECYINNKWRYIPSMDHERLSASAVTVREHIYLIGGFVNGTPSNSILSFDTRDETWNEMTDLPFGVADSIAVVYLNYIIVVGGLLDDFTVSDRCIVYDTENDIWLNNESTVRLKTPRYIHAGTILENGRLIVTGGRLKNGKSTTSMEAIYIIGLLPPNIRHTVIRTADDVDGYLPIHRAALHGLGWDQGMKYLIDSYPESLDIQTNDGDIPIILAAAAVAANNRLDGSRPTTANLTIIYKMFKAMLSFNYI